MKDLIVIKDRSVLPIEDGFVEVSQYKDGIDLVKGRGYVKDNLIYIYRGKNKKGEPMIPASLYMIKGKPVFVAPSDDDIEKYALSKLIKFDKQGLDSITKDDFNDIDPELVDLNTGEYFAPPIKESDDILKRLIKKVLQKRKINIRMLKSKFLCDYKMNNMKSALTKVDGNMSIKYFQEWCEVLGISVSLTAIDISTNLPEQYKFNNEITVDMSELGKEDEIEEEENEE